MKKLVLIITSKVKLTFRFIEGLLNQIEKFFLISNYWVILCIMLKKSCGQNSFARKPLSFSLLNTSPECFYRQDHIFPIHGPTVLYKSEGEVGAVNSI